jgi:hypothetical protein
MKEPLTTAEARALHLGRAILELIELGAFAFGFDRFSDPDGWDITIFGSDLAIFDDLAIGIEVPDLVNGLIDIAEEAQERKGKASMRTDGDGPEVGS